MNSCMDVAVGASRAVARRCASSVMRRVKQLPAPTIAFSAGVISGIGTARMRFCSAALPLSCPARSSRCSTALHVQNRATFNSFKKWINANILNLVQRLSRSGPIVCKILKNYSNEMDPKILSARAHSFNHPSSPENKRHIALVIIVIIRINKF